jgi:hypothetical protein
MKESFEKFPFFGNSRRKRESKGENKRRRLKMPKRNALF